VSKAKLGRQGRVRNVAEDCIARRSLDYDCTCFCLSRLADNSCFPRRLNTLALYRIPTGFLVGRRASKECVLIRAEIRLIRSRPWPCVTIERGRLNRTRFFIFHSVGRNM
ncbi:unnamed protein product, partial [Scytosiphon promiscuus]